MDEELKQQFKIKNLEILKNKLKLDVHNNMNTLTLSLNHILDLEVSTAMNKTALIYYDADVRFNDGDQEEILISLGKKYIEVTKEYLKIKKTDLIKTIEAFTVDTDISTYYGVIENTELEVDEFLKEQLSSYIDEKLIVMINKLNKRYVSVAQKDFVLERLLNFLKDNFIRRLSSKTVEQINLRNQTLINNAKDNYERYITLPTNIG